jgi:hypothetical protein
MEDEQPARLRAASPMNALREERRSQTLLDIEDLDITHGPH